MSKKNPFESAGEVIGEAVLRQAKELTEIPEEQKRVAVAMHYAVAQLLRQMIAVTGELGRLSGKDATKCAIAALDLTDTLMAGLLAAIEASEPKPKD